MRIWDINPGYLNRQSLLGEHRELHAILSIIRNNKSGYSKHPETMRWKEYTWALTIRHSQLLNEMSLRGYNEKTPPEIPLKNIGKWPNTYINSPIEQFEILKKKYTDKEQGRIPLPKNIQFFWAQHKYSIMARDQNLYHVIGKEVVNVRSFDEYDSLVLKVTSLINTAPPEGGTRNAVQHMWGYVSKLYYSENKDLKIDDLSSSLLLNIIQEYSYRFNIEYLLHSTALSELMVWI